MSAEVNTHAARTLMNRDPELREWVEGYLKEQERVRFTNDNPQASAEDFNRHWRYVRPERMHEGAVEAVTAHRERNDR